MFSELTAQIKMYDIPINSEFYGDGPQDMLFPIFLPFSNLLMPGNDWVISIIYIKENMLTF